jgi:dolichyl-phosphate-mannose-protein mannosyltransferase
MNILRNRKAQENFTESPLTSSNDLNDYSKTKPWRSPANFLDEAIDAVFRYSPRDTIIALVLFSLSLSSRLYNIQGGPFVIWDEAHFGKFASYYLKRHFYFDVHPPLGKMLVAFGGLLANYNGSFEFESGKPYPDDLNYTTMRVFLSLFGSAVVPLAYLTCLELGLSKKSSLLAALLVLFDNALLSISRYILLDSMLLFFTVSTFYSLIVFTNYKKSPFSYGWWIWLFATGASIGCVSSVKWVGFFVTALVGLYTIQDLWIKLGDLSVPLFPTFTKHFFARVICLIILPVSIYVSSFLLHFSILNESGPGDAQMPSLFQAQLQRNPFFSNPLHVAYGSRVTLKNNGYGGGLLHSHVQTYPEGSKQQQVTVYHHKDTNNDWIIKKVRERVHDDIEKDEIELVKNGDTIRLVHAETHKNLHSHPVKGPKTKSMWEVSGYGNDTIGDDNDYWQVEIINDLNGNSLDIITSLTTQFRLRHIKLDCYLRSHNIPLPEWGFKQGEVVCDRSKGKELNNVWNVEQHWNDKMKPNNNTENYKTNFWNDFIHLNVAMWSSNNALTPDPEKEDKLISVPMQWPLALVGLRMCGWGDNDYKVYLLGNPIVWWSAAFSLIFFCILTFLYILGFRRGYGLQMWAPIKIDGYNYLYQNTIDPWERFVFRGSILLLGWILHFVPFTIMGRVTYLHHYFPALYFGILMTAFLVDHITSFHLYPKNAQHYVIGNVVSLLIYCALLGAVVWSFFQFAPLSYGSTMPQTEFKDLKWLESWNIVD